MCPSVVFYNKSNMITEADRMVSVLLTLVENTELSQYWTALDTRQLRSSVEAEGVAFLTNTLPKLGGLLSELLREGKISTPVEGFKCVRGHVYPTFMKRAWETLVEKRTEHDTPFKIDYLRYDLDTSNVNSLRLELSHELAGAVKAIRQVSLMYYKTKLPYSADQVRSVSDAFVQTEVDLADLDLSAQTTRDKQIVITGDGMCVTTVDTLLTRASRIVHMLLHRFDPMDIMPRHGSGASACKTKPWERYKRPRFISKLDAVYPYRDWFFLSQAVDASDSDRVLDWEDTPMARVVFVPKDSRGPRLISAEPREFMFIQQGLMTQLYRAIESYPMVKAQLDCRDQTRNQRLARWGSETNAVATLDLKEASDRVSVQLVERLFPKHWVKSLLACRSEGTVLPDGRVVLFRKFAPMGSAVCFPVEAICFWAIANAVCWTGERYFDRLFDCTSDIYAQSNQLAVFGDDIIVPTGYASSVISALEAVGLLVNRNKSYTEGPFRESCGAEFFLGEDVSIVRCREVPWSEGGRRKMDRARFRTCDWFNNLILRYGTYCLSEPLRHLFEEWYGDVVVSSHVTVPTDNEFQSVSVPSRGLVLLGSFRLIPERWRHPCRDEWTPREIRGLRRNGNRRPPKDRLRWNHELDRLEVLTLIESPEIIQIDTDDWSHLLRILLCGSGTLDASMWTLAKRCKYKYGWIPV
jgi:hypothetical protein